MCHLGLGYSLLAVALWYRLQHSLCKPLNKLGHHMNVKLRYVALQNVLDILRQIL